MFWVFGFGVGFLSFGFSGYLGCDRLVCGVFLGGACGGGRLFLGFGVGFLWVGWLVWFSVPVLSFLGLWYFGVLR